MMEILVGFPRFNSQWERLRGLRPRQSVFFPLSLPPVSISDSAFTKGGR